MKTGNHPTATEKQFEKIISIILRIFGAVLILYGVIAIICYTFKDCLLASDKLAEIFFLIMMGVGFAYPDLLKDQNKGLSTMRLVVFMMVNVICLLLLKTGWDKPDLGSIKIDAYWMGIIAFVFGAKATQTYFESKLALPPLPDSSQAPTLGGPVPQPLPDAATLITEAIRQHQALRSQFPNIVDMMLGSTVQNGHNVFCVDIVLSDNKSTGIPIILGVSYNQSQYSVPAIIITGAGAAVSHAHAGDHIINQSIPAGAPGTLGCILVDPATQQKCVLSACHVFSNDVWNPGYTGFNVPQNTITDTTSNEQLGFWQYGLMNSFYDIGYVQLDASVTISPSGFGTPKDVTAQDILHKTPVTFKGATSGQGKAKISNTGAMRTVTYSGKSVQIGNLILITNNGTAPSAKGDSGSLVYTDDNIQNPIGLLIAADQIYSYVIPIKDILSTLNMLIY